MTATRIKPLALYARVSNLGRRSLEDLRSVEMQRAEATVAVRTLGYEVDEPPPSSRISTSPAQAKSRSGRDSRTRWRV
jgi:hypothetical protein